MADLEVEVAPDLVVERSDEAAGGSRKRRDPLRGGEPRER
jgi:hypothetical protein